MTSSLGFCGPYDLPAGEIQPRRPRHFADGKPESLEGCLDLSEGEPSAVFGIEHHKGLLKVLAGDVTIGAAAVACP